ncbi:conserved hypothetical protein [Nostocoides australiense Ben110]|uniref:Tubulin/FtsZ GTPase domain-containing protein n=1 Tax=Nostocoides australiense Ben110 TaxID=1193182 RepID=W6K2T9_9MICO|nr:tubulin-like doman-containing protein [Tetrasphaera australiensis]CCH75430.1 conserved hypothetical protein [Tetrasphaera australiensis Ben110]
MTSNSHSHDHDHGACDSESAGFATDAARLQALVTDGVHRVGPHEGPFSLHVLGIGKAGTNIVEAMVRAHQEDPNGIPLHALAIDIGDEELRKLEAAGTDKATVRTTELPVLSSVDFFAGLRRYREFLKAEFPRYYWNPNYEPWLPNDMEMPSPGDHFHRAVSKGLYGVDYYTGGVTAEALDDFANEVVQSEQTPLVVIVFSIAGGTGSGIVPELARHLSNIRLGRRQLVLGIGVLPCDGDPDELSDGRTFIAINELDCLIDGEKNAGVVTVWGDLYRNAFTAGFFAVPQCGVYDKTGGNLEETHQIIDRGIADFVLRDGGLHVYETIKALNWMNVPADAWHPATRGDHTDRWITLLSVGLEADDPLPTREIVPEAQVPYAEVRGFGVEAEALKATADTLQRDVAPRVGPNVLSFDSAAGSAVTTIIPQLSKRDLALFGPARSAYDGLGWEDKLLRHAWLLDVGVLLCEPSTRFEGVGGECLLGCACWVVVPYAAIRGEDPVAVS